MRIDEIEAAYAREMVLRPGDPCYQGDMVRLGVSAQRDIPILIAAVRGRDELLRLADEMAARLDPPPVNGRPDRGALGKLLRIATAYRKARGAR